MRRLKAENLFLISLDEENRWFRYHHLFQRLLRNQLQRHRSPEHIATLHERAGDWFARNGMIDEAIQHALKAGNAPKAVQLFGRHRHALFETGAWVVLEDWLVRIPEALVDEYPDLLMAKAQLLFYQNRFHLLPAIVDRAESLLPVDSAAAESIVGEIQFFRGVSHLMGGDGHLCMKSLETALPRIPATHQGFRGMALIVYGLACQMTGRQETVLTRLAGVLDDPSSNFEMQLRMIRGLLWVQLISGDLSAAETLVHQMRATAIGKQNLAHLTLSSHAFGLIQFHRCEFDAAIQNFKAAAEHSHLLMRRNRIDSMVGLALALQAKARWDEASGCMADLMEYAHATGDLSALAIAKSGQARLRCHSVEAEDPGFPEAIDGGGVSQNHAMLWWLEVPAITRCRVLLADGSEAGLGEAEKRLRDYLRQNRAQHNRCQAMDIMALLAVTVHRLGQPDEALKILDELVRLAEPEGWVRPFVEAGPPMPDLLEQLKVTGVCVAFVERLLHTIAELEPTEERRGLQPASRPPNAQQPRIEPLTKREQDILDLLVRRWQNKEIAARLCVSPETVKSHLKNVYRKLDVRGRRQAVVKARELGILFPK
ncbi:MAG: LuxR C-terminal-related transcriptional regulator [Desulfobacterales bacterium]